MILSLSDSYFILVIMLILSNFIHVMEIFSIKASYSTLIFLKKDKNERSAVDLHVPKTRKIFCTIQALFSVFVFIIALIDYQAILFKLLFGILTAFNFYMYKSRKIGRDGADQIRIFSFLIVSLCFLATEPLSQILPLIYVGIQLLIAYGTSGMAKLTSPHWRRGNVLADILHTRSYSSKQVAIFLKKRPLLEKILSHSVIFMMLLVVVSFFTPFTLVFYFALAGMFVFHVSTALLMGLNDFLFTMPLMYPAVLYLHTFFHTQLV